MELDNIRRLLTEEDAVTPVIGIILVVAITVILAAIVGVYALGVGTDVQNAPPNADFDFDYANTDTDGIADDKVTIEHNGGQPIERDNIEVVVGGETRDPVSGNEFPTRFSSGDSAVYDLDGSTDAGETLRIIWTAPNGESSNTIGESQVPN
jgi:FlaG/FlaF family flagellin (archaellin)